MCTALPTRPIKYLLFYTNTMHSYVFHLTDSLDADILSDYLKAHQNVFPEAEGRIRFQESTGNDSIPSITSERATSPTPETATSSIKAHVIVHKCQDTGINVGANFNVNFILLLICSLFLRMSL